ncbi:MAG: sulfatase-like hydrolase/transferase [Planctomycetota bacterium]
MIAVRPLTGVGLPALLGFFVLLTLAAPAASQHNFLVLLADDLGPDLIAAYGEDANAAPTPHLSALAAEGVLFRRVYAAPVCSPMRASFLTGKHPLRTGIGQGLAYFGASYELRLSELTLPEALAPLYTSALAGKWHVAALALSGPQHPLLCGFSQARGNMEIFTGGVNDNFYSYTKYVNGVPEQANVYDTTGIVDDALELIAELPQPWFLWTAFNAPHAPFHKPPQALHTYDLPASVGNNVPVHVRAVTEALDTEIGRLLDSMDPAVRANTIVIFLGDNGTDAPAVMPPLQANKVKATVFEGGIRVPLIISGPGVARGEESTALVSSTDLFATLVELAGIDLQAAGHTPPPDSTSFAAVLADPALPSPRPWVYAEMYGPVGFTPHSFWRRAVRDERYKLMWLYSNSSTPTTQAFYDLLTDPHENINLLSGNLTPEQAQARTALEAVLNGLHETWATFGAGLAGSRGVPQISGSGSLLPHTPVNFQLEGLLENSFASMVAGVGYAGLPFKGGIFHPTPSVLLPGLATGPAGVIALNGTWPAGIPAQSYIYYQAWVTDPAGPFGYSATGALVSITP